jgi:triosephosphate isomerase
MTPLIGTSFKMNLTSTEVRRYLETLKPLVEPLTTCDLFVLPPFTAIWAARESLRGTRVAWGAQDVHHEPSGAHTGDVSALMLADLGCTFVEVGHSERRRDHGETDEAIGLKVKTVLDHGMTPILCVGEPARWALEEAVAHVTRQLRIGLRCVAADRLASVVIAYEPVWAIGAGATAADPGHVEAMHAAINRTLDAAVSRVIYGGSVDRDTAVSLLDRGHVDGLFVGRSALDPTVFAAIARAAR